MVAVFSLHTAALKSGFLEEFLFFGSRRLKALFPTLQERLLKHCTISSFHLLVPLTFAPLRAVGNADDNSTQKGNGGSGEK